MQDRIGRLMEDQPDDGLSTPQHGVVAERTRSRMARSQSTADWMSPIPRKSFFRPTHESLSAPPGYPTPLSPEEPLPKRPLHQPGLLTSTQGGMR